MSLAVTRTVQRSVPASPDAARVIAAAATAMASAWGNKSSAAWVGIRPRWERVNNDKFRSASSVAMCRPMVGWVVARRRAAPERLPSRTTSRKLR